MVHLDKGLVWFFAKSGGKHTSMYTVSASTENRALCAERAKAFGMIWKRSSKSLFRSASEVFYSLLHLHSWENAIVPSRTKTINDSFLRLTHLFSFTPTLFLFVFVVSSFVLLLFYPS